MMNWDNLWRKLTKTNSLNIVYNVRKNKPIMNSKSCKNNKAKLLSRRREMISNK